MTGKKRKQTATAPRASEWTPDSDQKAGAVLLYDELINTRDRLAGLPPLTPLDLECATRALHEVVFFLLTPLRGRMTPLAVPEPIKRQLVEAARNRDLDLYVTASALVASKLAQSHETADLAASHLDGLRNALDALTFDYRRPKGETLAMLRVVRADMDGRIAYVTKSRRSGYRFRELPETYAERTDKRERPDQFFHRVYGTHVARGLAQADIRAADPAYYNVLHVWCTRHKRKLSVLVPATRARRA